jgi:hypothetical protein
MDAGLYRAPRNGTWHHSLSLYQMDQYLDETNETHYERALGRDICNAQNIFGPPNDLHNCGKIDHKHPFGWIDYPAPFLLNSVDQQHAENYAD